MPASWNQNRLTSRYRLYMQDYGGPVGFRMALAHPDRIEALIVQEPWRTTKAWVRIGSRGGPFGPIAPPTKARFAQISCRCHDADAPCRERSQRGTL